MLYKFKTKAAGDVIMTAPVGDKMLRLMGREPAAKGIFLSADMPACIAALEQAIAAEEAARAKAEQEAREEGHEPPAREAIGLRQRAWPLVEQLRRSHAEGQDVVWGV